MELTISATNSGTHTLKIVRINKSEKNLDYTLLPKIYDNYGSPVDLLHILNSIPNSGNQYFWSPPSQQM